MAKLEIKGLDKLEKQLKKNVKMDDIKRVVKHHGAQLQQKAQDKADFRGHWGYRDGKKEFLKPTGYLKGSIGLEIKAMGFTAEVGPTAEYGIYVELGTRFMDAQPYLSPALAEQKVKFKRDLDKLTK